MPMLEAIDTATDLPGATPVQQTNGALHTAVGGQTPLNSWSVTHNPAANTTATISQAAGGAGVRNVCTSIYAALNAAAAAPTATIANVVLRDGAAGAGTIVWSGRIAVPAVAGGGNAPIQLSGLHIVGTANTAMTLEFAGAAGANTHETVSMTGYTY